MKNMLHSLSLLLTVLLAFSPRHVDSEDLPQPRELRFQSSRDKTVQPARIWVPESAEKEKRPLFVFLHSWSGDYKQDNSKWLAQAVEREWIFLHPDFRGRNDHPEACGSELARQDILDCMKMVLETADVDEERIYLAGSSGGGHMTMLMAGYYPDRFSAASAWVGISDLEAWYHRHTRDGVPGRYATMIRLSTGGIPGESKQIDAEYHARSPIHHIHRVGDLPIDLNTGIHDGHTGSVPITHTLNAFNRIAKENDYEQISISEIQSLLKRKPLLSPRETDQVSEEEYGCKIYLRRHAGPARVTVFDGGHTSFPEPACDWLSRHRRETNW